jgi:hypothetical protein
MHNANPLRSALLLALIAAPLSAQSIQESVTRTRDGSVRMAFAARQGVCGYGAFIGEDTPEGFRSWWIGVDGMSVDVLRDVRPACEEGPVRVRVEKRDGRIVRLELAVGGSWRADGGAIDLGTLRAGDAADWLLDVAQGHPDEDVIRSAMFAATLADGARIGDRLLAIVGDPDARAAVRDRAMRHVTEVASREGGIERADHALRRVAADPGERADLRERAVRELRSTPANDAFLREAFAGGGPTELRERILRRLGEAPTDENVAWLRGIAEAEREPADLRERAIRVLGEIGTTAELRALFSRLRHPDLQDRVVRVVAEQEGRAAGPWLHEIATTGTVPVDVRERAVRLLAEQRNLDALRSLYDDLDRPDLRERVLREVGDREDDASLSWVEAVARSDDESVDVRERAVRILGDSRMESERLASLYDEIGMEELRERLIRILEDRRDADAVAKLRAIASSDPNRDLRELARRRLR